MGLELQVAVVALLVAAPVTFLLRFPTKAGRHLLAPAAPRIGGFSIVTAFIAAPFIVAIFSADARGFVRNDWHEFLALGLCGGVVFAVGAWDDFRDLSWRVKFGAQTAAAVALYANGYHIGEMTLPGGGTVALGVLDPFVTVFWLVFITNAMNLIDGRDGVAAGVAAMVGATMSFVAWDLGHDLIALLFATLAGACLGFVPFNLPTAKRFLGDSGAYFLGFTIAALSVAGFVDSTGRVPLYIPLVALGLPVLDAGIAVVRRYLDARHPFEADQDHFHDRIERIFRLAPLQVALVTYGLSAAFCLAALLLHHWYKSFGSAVVGLGVGVFSVLLLATLGYVSSMWNSVRVLSVRGRRAHAPQEGHL